MAARRKKASEALDPILRAGKAVNVAELAEHLISALGGTPAFAALYAEEVMKGTKPGTVSRARMLDGVLRVVGQASAQQKGKQVDEGEMSDEELAAVATELLRKAQTAGSSPASPPGGAASGA